MGKKIKPSRFSSKAFKLNYGQIASNKVVKLVTKLFHFTGKNGKLSTNARTGFKAFQ
jgi:hypothetical protein